MHSVKDIRPVRGLVALLQTLVLGCAITVISINRYQLVNVYVYAFAWPHAYYLVECAYDPNSCTPCNYLYSLGALSIFFGFFVSLCQCFSSGNLMLNVILDITLSAGNLGWWIAGAVYFTAAYHDAQNNGSTMDVNDYRRGVYAVAWTAVGLSTVSLILSIYACYAARKLAKQGKLPEQQLAELETAAAQAAAHGAYVYPNYPPPPPAAYGSPPPAGYGVPPPAGYPPAPGGYPPVAAVYPALKA